MRKLLLICFFSIQLGAIFFAIGRDQKYFAWVPYDQISTYEINVKLGSKQLSLPEVSRRYKLPNPGRENRAISHVFFRIANYEQTYGKEDTANVRVTYRVNGKAEETWIFKD